jgi:uncharacterized protein YcfJ
MGMSIMKKLLLLSTTLLASSLAIAQDVGRVISSTPIIQQVGVPRQVCTAGQVAVQQPKSGAGALIGAIAGGAMGNAVGGGAGKAAATMIGLMGGAMVGDQIEGGSSAQFQNAQRCVTQTSYENRPVAYNVVYEFGGKQYSVQMPSDPGPTLQLQVTPVGSSVQAALPAATVTYAQPGYEQSTYPVSPPVYSGYYQPGYYQPNYVVPFALGIGFGYLGGHRAHGHWR